MYLFLVILKKKMKNYFISFMERERVMGKNQITGTLQDHQINAQVLFWRKLL